MPKPREEIVHVADRLGGADRGRGVLVGLDLGFQRLVADLLPPDGRGGDEEALLLGEAVDLAGVAVGLQVGLEGVVGDLDAAQVGDVLGDGELAVDEESGQDLDRAVLGDDLVVQRLEGGVVGIGPPVGAGCRRRRTGSPAGRSRG